MKKELEKSHLERINIDNLQHGLDSEGRDMPFYSNSEYGFKKFASNPKNRGHWDLKNTGQYYSGIKYTVRKDVVKFSQVYNNKKITWLDMMLEKANRTPLGLEKQQFIEIQKDIIPKVRIQILNIINNGM
ncbi:hypothetical protein [Elizabethkingia argenteiflava]|uniref:hypothetical protein n=1 Tax=Elizabethkingia argenteiflava TaxID=2681556 RepID=UPI0014125E4D|nr:hypothetical protein [Elizabethkingia argenteiflava]